MATSASSVGAEHPDATPPAPRPPLLRRAHRSVPAGVWYTLGALGVAVLVVALQLVVHAVKSDPRNARAIVERELTLNTIQPGERVIRMVPVFRRNAVDYYRQTRGYLVLTDKRLLYLGAPPRDITGSSDAPPTFDQREFPVDTLTTLSSGYATLGFARAITIDSPGETLKLGVQRRSWPKALLLEESFSGRHRKLEALGQWAAKVRGARAQLQKIVAEYRKQPVYHIVRPGDALGSIATWYEVSPDQIRQQNSIVGNKIKVGQRLLIRSGS